MSVLDFVGIGMILLLCVFGFYAFVQNYRDYIFIENNLANIIHNVNKYDVTFVRVGCRYRFISERHNLYTDYMMPSETMAFINSMNGYTDLVKFLKSNSKEINLTDSINLFGEIKPSKPRGGNRSRKLK